MAGLQKKMAAKILKVGKSRVWVDPTKLKDISQAITKADIRKAIKKKWIKKIPSKVPYPEIRGRNKIGIGRRKGRKFSVVTAKQKWMSTIRPLRAVLKELKDTQQIDRQTHKKMYLLAKGGMFRSKSHIRLYLEQHNLLKKK